MNAVWLDTATKYSSDGELTVRPCTWEQGKDTPFGLEASRRGRLTVSADGGAVFKPYRENARSSRYLLSMTYDGVSVRTTKKDVIVSVRLPKQLSADESARLYTERLAAFAQHFKTA